MANPAVWTIGHSNHGVERLLELLGAEQIAYVVDVRSYPYSRFAPQFNREQLAPALNAHGVQYLFLGAELGGRPERAEHYDAEGRALYAQMAATAAFRDALSRVRDGARDHRIALLCSEADPTSCHRRLLVGKVLAGHGVELRHILPDGRIAAERAVALPGEQNPQRSLLDEETPVEIYTIGFTQSTAERFFGRLADASIERLLDVRLSNTSQLAGFAKAADLPYFLDRLAGARYEHEPRLAPTRELLDRYKKEKGSWAEYEREFLALMRTRCIERVFSPSEFVQRTVLLCSEAGPERCHRRLVCEYLAEHWPDVIPVHL